ncbi:MAG: type I pantothenate kinase [Rhodobiaceae bacterium]|nr:type I pantothenate kinase [Rhodobiaceae bacterium]MCC0016032.1 type I pantothenate kinase [Rhodobiaceae bacterium]
MDQIAATELSPYQTFTREQWAELRADTPMTLTSEEVDHMRGLNEQLSMDEVEDIYLPMSRLLSLYVEATQSLFRATQEFLRAGKFKVPYIIGIGGSVAAGKSTTARVLKALLARWPNTPKVDLVTTDGFLFPNAALEAEGLMQRKGFPESYDLPALLEFLTRIKAGDRSVPAPVYSHFSYDIVEGQHVVVDRPDILILEGLNVLQTGTMPRDGEAIPFVSDFFDFSIYLDADVDVVEQWYVSRFLRLRTTAFRDPGSYFHRYAQLDDDAARETALGIWKSINFPNLVENVRPTRHRADLILRKGNDHRIETVNLRKL